MSEINEYEVVFLMDDKTTVLDKQIVKAGETVKYKGKMPEKETTLDGVYVFEGWTNSEQLKDISDNVTCVAVFRLETKANMETIMYKLTQLVAKTASLNETISAGKKVSSQQRATELDKRSIQEMIAEIKEKGQIEIGDIEQEQSIDNEI